MNNWTVSVCILLNQCAVLCLKQPKCELGISSFLWSSCGRRLTIWHWDSGGGGGGLAGLMWGMEGVKGICQLQSASHQHLDFPLSSLEPRQVKQWWERSNELGGLLFCHKQWLRWSVGAMKGWLKAETPSVPANYSDKLFPNFRILIRSIPVAITLCLLDAV